MILKFITQLFGNLFLPLFNNFVGKFIHLAAFHAKYVIMVLLFGQFKNGISTLKVVSSN